jgi:hypothetical protein
MREYLVTTFNCTRCGGVLEVQYGTGGAMPESSKDDITGGSKVDAKVFIMPCEKCWGEAVRPIQQLRSALSDVAAFAKREKP